MNKKRSIEICEHIDRLITTDFHTRKFIIDLYEAARKVMKVTSLTQKAGQDINNRVKEGDTILILPGFPTFGNYIAEQDGPVGASIFARTITEIKDIRTIVLTDKAQANMVKECFRATGFTVYDNPNEVSHKTQAGIIGVKEGVPFDGEKLVDEFNPSLVISIERPSRNSEGKYMSMKGLDLSYKIAPVDTLIDLAFERGILTVGIGDGGNEAGCGLIRDAVVECHPNGHTMASSVITDDLVFASASNLGAYGLSGALSLLNEDIYSLPNKDTLYFALTRSAQAGLHNGPPLWLDPGTDGIPFQLEMFVLESIRRMIWEEINPHFPKFY
jgi:hypothetical protein